MNEYSLIGERPQCSRVESPEDGLSVRQIGEIRGSQWGKEPGELLQLQGKRTGRVPQWLRQILDRDFDGHFPAEWHWVDHWGRAGETFITEPYRLSDLEVQQIMEFCGRYRLRFRIRAESQHYPTRTLCIEIWPL